MQQKQSKLMLEKQDKEIQEQKEEARIRQEVEDLNR
jgi:hypothetical protein